MTSILAADSIGKMYGRRKVLVSARLEAHAGTITLVAGRNGAGKSTLLKIVAGRLSADSGLIRFAGKVFQRPSLSRLARDGLFYLPDRGLLSPFVPFRKQLEAVAARFGSTGAETIARELGLEEVLTSKPYSLSGGELRRAEFCLAAVRNPLCLIADEPIRGIDPKDAELLMRHFQLLAQRGCAVVVSGHTLGVLLERAASVIWVTSGTTYVLGSPAQAAAHPQFRKEYLLGRWQ